MGKKDTNWKGVNLDVDVVELGHFWHVFPAISCEKYRKILSDHRQPKGFVNQLVEEEILGGPSQLVSTS